MSDRLCKTCVWFETNIPNSLNGVCRWVMPPIIAKATGSERIALQPPVVPSGYVCSAHSPKVSS